MVVNLLSALIYPCPGQLMESYELCTVTFSAPQYVQLPDRKCSPTRPTMMVLAQNLACSTQIRSFVLKTPPVLGDNPFDVLSRSNDSIFSTLSETTSIQGLLPVIRKQFAHHAVRSRSSHPAFPCFCCASPQWYVVSCLNTSKILTPTRRWRRWTSHVAKIQ